MPLLQNAKKALRVSKRKAVINSRVKSRVKSAVQTLKATPSKDAVAHAYSRMDRAVKRNVIPKNRAARLKSQLSKLASQA
ncbi:MAG: 30S ribosomal protein S20 [Patescibacteria group bacterium]